MGWELRITGVILFILMIIIIVLCVLYTYVNKIMNESIKYCAIVIIYTITFCHNIVPHKILNKHPTTLVFLKEQSLIDSAGFSKITAGFDLT